VAIAVANAEVHASRRPAGEGGVGARVGGVEEGVLLGLASLDRARAAVHPGEAAVGVDLHGLGHRRRAEPHGDHVLQGAQGQARRGWDLHVALLLGELPADDGLGADLVPAEHIRHGHLRGFRVE
jgi:hypothetical protein